MTNRDDKRWMNRAVEIALASEREGNLPIGAVITLDGEAIAEGNSAILEPRYNPGRHAEIVALEGVDDTLWPRAGEMTCYTTLEPCVMCAGTLLLHGVGRVVFGAHDKLGGAGPTLDHLPPYYDDGGVYAWEGPLMPDLCDPLYARADAAFENLPVGRAQWTGTEHSPSDDTPESLRSLLERWLRDDPDDIALTRARNAVAELADRLDDDRRGEVLPYAKAVFRRGGYLKDYRALQRYCRRAGAPDPFVEVEETVRRRLPDVWIRRAIERGDLQAAIDGWFDAEDHHRARLCADELVDACDDDQVQVIISCRMATVSYLVGRRTRRYYRRACTVLRKLRDELQRAGASEFWQFILDDLRDQYPNRPALIDELERAGFIDAPD